MSPDGSRLAKLKWSESSPSIGIATATELRGHLDRIAADRNWTGERRSQPVIVTLMTQGFEVGMGLGFPESFIHVEDLSHAAPTSITVGNPRRKGVVPFYLHAAHHTEIPRRNLISLDLARAVFLEFFEIGLPSSKVKWEQI